jgi:hypothetical protein
MLDICVHISCSILPASDFGRCSSACNCPLATPPDQLLAAPPAKTGCSTIRLIRVLVDSAVACAGAIAVDDRCSSVDAVLGSGSDNQASPLSVEAAATASNGVLLIPNPALQSVRNLAD